MKGTKSVSGTCSSEPALVRSNIENSTRDRVVAFSRATPESPLPGCSEIRAAAAALRLEPLRAGMEVSHLEVDGDLSAEVGVGGPAACASL